MSPDSRNWTQALLRQQRSSWQPRLQPSRANSDDCSGPLQTPAHQPNLAALLPPKTPGDKRLKTSRAATYIEFPGQPAPLGCERQHHCIARLHQVLPSTPDAHGCHARPPAACKNSDASRSMNRSGIPPPEPQDPRSTSHRQTPKGLLPIGWTTPPAGWLHGRHGPSASPAATLQPPLVYRFHQTDPAQIASQTHPAV